MTWIAVEATDLSYWPRISAITDADGGIDFTLYIQSMDEFGPDFYVQSYPAATIASGFTERP